MYIIYFVDWIFCIFKKLLCMFNGFHRFIFSEETKKSNLNSKQKKAPKKATDTPKKSTDTPKKARSGPKLLGVTCQSNHFLRILIIDSTHCSTHHLHHIFKNCLVSDFVKLQYNTQSWFSIRSPLPAQKLSFSN